MSKNGRSIVFSAQLDAAQLFTADSYSVDLFVRDRSSRSTRTLTGNGESASGHVVGLAWEWGSVSADGRLAVIRAPTGAERPGGGDGYHEIHLVDLRDGSLSLISRGSQGEPIDGDCGAPAISPGARFVAFSSGAGNLAAAPYDTRGGVYVFDRDSGLTTRVDVATDGTVANAGGGACAISDTGTVAFSSDATNLVEGDDNDSTDVFVHDLITGETRRLSVSSNGAERSGDSWVSSIAADGSLVVFNSVADGLDAADGNGVQDVYVAEVGSGEVRLLSVNAEGEVGNGPSGAPLFSAMSLDGNWCVFDSAATNLARDDRNGAVRDVFRVRIRR